MAPRAQTAAPEGEAEVILTVSRLPEGARDLLGDAASKTYSEETGKETFTLSSLEQLEPIEALAQEQGITAGRFNGGSGTGILLRNDFIPPGRRRGVSPARVPGGPAQFSQWDSAPAAGFAGRRGAFFRARGYRQNF